MPWKDKLEHAKKIFRNGTPKQKWDYIWDYYKWHLLILFVFLGLLVSTIYALVTAKECVSGGVFLNTNSVEEEVIKLEQGFLEHSSVDTKKEEIYFATNHYVPHDTDSLNAARSYETLQLMSAKIGAGEIDFMVGDIASMNDFAYWQYFYDLSEVLSAEMIEKYEPYFHYYDRSVVPDIQDIHTIEELLSPIVYPDSKKPELMEDPVPIFIDVSECEKLRGIYPCMEETYVIAFTANGEGVAVAVEFLDYLLE